MLLILTYELHDHVLVPELVFSDIDGKLPVVVCVTYFQMFSDVT